MKTVNSFLVILFCFIVTFFVAFNYGKSQERNKWKLQYAEAQIQINELQSRQPEINEIIIKEYVDRIKYIDRVKVQDRIIKEYITIESDQNCTIPNGFVTIHNAAAIPIEPPPPNQLDNQPSDIVLSQLTSVIVDNYTKYHTVKIQLESLQNWIREQQQLWSKYE
jgi:hypothetical protein